MSPKRLLQVKILIGALLALGAAAAFSAYLKPGMLVEFANLVLCT